MELAGCAGWKVMVVHDVAWLPGACSICLTRPSHLVLCWELRIRGMLLGEWYIVSAERNVLPTRTLQHSVHVTMIFSWGCWWRTSN